MTITSDFQSLELIIYYDYIMTLIPHYVHLEITNIFLKYKRRKNVINQKSSQWENLRGKQLCPHHIFSNRSLKSHTNKKIYILTEREICHIVEYRFMRPGTSTHTRHYKHISWWSICKLMKCQKLWLFRLKYMVIKLLTDLTHTRFI